MSVTAEEEDYCKKMFFRKEAADSPRNFWKDKSLLKLYLEAVDKHLKIYPKCSGYPFCEHI